MDSSTRKANRKLARGAGYVFGAMQVTVPIVEILTRPNRDVFTEMLGSVVSLHSLYIGVAFGGLIIMVVCSWPLFQWLWDIGERRRKKEQEQLTKAEDERLAKIQELNEIVTNNLKSLQLRTMDELDGNRINHIENHETIKILTNDLKAMGFDLPDIKGMANYLSLHDCVSKLLPQVKLFGVEQIIDELKNR